MKNVRLSLYALSISVLLFACAQSGESQNAQTPAVEAAAGSQEALRIKDGELNAVYPLYQELNQALVQSDHQAASIAAATLARGAQELKGEGQEVYVQAERIAAAEDIQEQRAAFSELSNAIIVLVKESGLEAGELYVDFCPMALNDKGAYWLSSEKGIRNPYFGDRMLSCGETKETL